MNRQIREIGYAFKAWFVGFMVMGIPAVIGAIIEEYGLLAIKTLLYLGVVFLLARLIGALSCSDFAKEEKRRP